MLEDCDWEPSRASVNRGKPFLLVFLTDGKTNKNDSLKCDRTILNGFFNRFYWFFLKLKNQIYWFSKSKTQLNLIVFIGFFNSKND